MRCGEHELQTTLPHFLVTQSQYSFDQAHDVPVYSPAVMFPNENAELGVADGAKGDLSVGLPPWQD